MIIYEELVKQVNDLIDFDATDLLSLYPADHLERMIQNLPDINKKYHEAYLIQQGLFSPYVASVPEPILVLSKNSYLIVSDGKFVYVDQECSMTTLELDVPELEHDKEAFNKLILYTVDLCKSNLRFYGMFKVNPKLLYRFVKSVADYLMLSGRFTLPTDVDDIIYNQPDRKDFSTYTFLSTRSVAVGELRVRNNTLRVIVHKGDKYLSSYCELPKNCTREYKRLMIVYLAYMNGVCVENNRVFMWGDIDLWQESRMIGCYGDYMFK